MTNWEKFSRGRSSLCFPGGEGNVEAAHLKTYKIESFIGELSRRGKGAYRRGKRFSGGL